MSTGSGGRESFLCFTGVTEEALSFDVTCLDVWLLGPCAGINDAGIWVPLVGDSGPDFLFAATGERPDCGEATGEVFGVDCPPWAGRASRSDGLSFEGRRVTSGGEFA